MIIMKKDELFAIEDFVVEVDRDIRTLKDHLTILELDDEHLQLANKTLAMLERKVSLMKQAEDKKELKKVLRVKKLLGGKSL